MNLLETPHWVDEGELRLHKPKNAATLLVIDGLATRSHLSFDACIPLMRHAMIGLSRRQSAQASRSILDLPQGRVIGAMLGAMTAPPTFGAKLVSVFPDNHALGLPGHQGFVALFDNETGAPLALVNAAEVTRIRTAAASAAATDALARPDASVLAVLGHGEQATAHVEAILRVRKISEIRVWSRDRADAQRFAQVVEKQVGTRVKAADTVELAVANAHIVCTTTAASEPILQGAWLAPGCHVNVVGSSRAGPAEVDSALVQRSTYFADFRDAVLSQGAEFLRAKHAGLIGDEHIVAEIGEVFDGRHPGRTSEREVTLYKSLGNIVQDLSSAWYLYQLAQHKGFGQRVPF